MLSFYLSLIQSAEDKSKFQILYDEYRQLMKSIAYDKLQNKQLAEDAVQDAFIKIIKFLDGIDLDNGHKTKGFIVKVINSATIDIIRKENKYYKEPIDSINEVKIAKNNIFEEIGVKELVSKIKQLPEPYRDILELKIYYNISEKEIARLFGISYAAARKRLQRAREALLELIND